MKIRSTCCKLLLGMLLFSHIAKGQTAGDYRTIASGNWNTGTPSSVWQTFNGVSWIAAVANPTDVTANVITIRSPHTITVSSVANTTVDQVIVESGGTLSNTANTLTIADGAGTDLEVDGTLNLSTGLGVSGPGTVQVDGAMSWTGGTLSAPTTISSGATLTLNSNGTLATTLVNDGTINWTGNNLGFNNGTITNNATFNISGNNVFSQSTPSAFNNSITGTINKNSAGTTTISIPFTNAGTLNVNTGTVANSSAASSFINTGTLNLDGTLTLGGTLAGGNQLNAGTVLTGSGILNITQPAVIDVALAPPATLTTNIGLPANFSVTGSGSLTISGILNWSTGRVSIPITIDASGTFNSTAGKDINGDVTNNGIINLTDPNPASGSLDFEDITFTNNGTLNVNYATANRSFSNAAGFLNNSFVNTGLVNKASTFNLTINAGVPVTNSGTFQGMGIYLFSGGMTNTGTIAPGTPTTPAIMRTNNVVISATSNLEFEMFTSTTAGTGHDQLEISTGGITTLNGTLTIIDNPGTAPVGVYTIMRTIGGGTFAGTFATVNKPTNFNDPVVNATTVTIEKFAMFPLPVIWGEFKALAVNNQVKLIWTTLEEINTSHFILEHSVNGIEYSPIATIAARGNSSATTEYTYTHTTPNLGKLNYYRILQVDIDDKKEYSVIRTVRFNNGKVVAVQATPNPVKDVLQVSVQTDDIKIQLIDFNGKLLGTLLLQPGVHDINVANLPAGVYLLSIYQKQERIDVQKIIKQ